ncbi:MAG: hypothetical protein M3230_01220 [Thermoproteota archaeon]|nr:hypothetical protein [Thermoproteota archaeon]
MDAQRLYLTAIENDRVPLEHIRMTLEYVINIAEIAITDAMDDEVTESIAPTTGDNNNI